MRGQTLLELLLVLAVLAVLGGLAAPTLRHFALDLGRDATVDELARGLALARVTAQATGVTAQLCRASAKAATTNGTGSAAGCLDAVGEWTDGWQVAASGVLRHGSPASGQRLFGNRGSIYFSPSGAATPVTLVVCDLRGSAFARSLVVSRSGRVRTTNGGASCG